jgi:hypothetical protein
MIPHYDKCFETLFVSREGGADAQKNAPQPKGAFPPIGGHGMQVITFGKNNEVKHSYHSYDYADIYDPNRGKPKNCMAQ